MKRLSLYMAKAVKTDLFHFLSDVKNIYMNKFIVT